MCRELPIDFHQHVFLYAALFCIIEGLKVTLECRQVTGNKMELKETKTEMGMLGLPGG